MRYVNTIRGWVFSICQLLAIVFHEQIKLPVGQIVKGENRVKYTVNLRRKRNNYLMYSQALDIGKEF